MSAEDLTDEHLMQICRALGNSTDRRAVLSMAEELLDLREDKRRFLAVKMAVHGEFSGLARQLALWGIEPTR